MIECCSEDVGEKVEFIDREFCQLFEQSDRGLLAGSPVITSQLVLEVRPVSIVL